MISCGCSGIVGKITLGSSRLTQRASIPNSKSRIIIQTITQAQTPHQSSVRLAFAFASAHNSAFHGDSGKELTPRFVRNSRDAISHLHANDRIYLIRSVQHAVWKNQGIVSGILDKRRKSSDHHPVWSNLFRNLDLIKLYRVERHAL